MILIAIQGMGDGVRDVSLEVPVDEIENALPEFFGNITLEGTLRKLGNRFTFAGQAACMARLVCDRSLAEFDMMVKAEVSISFLSDTCTTKIEMDSKEAEFEENIFKHDDKQLDLTEEVIQRLIVSIPMKKVSPEYEDADFNEIFDRDTGQIIEDSDSGNSNSNDNYPKSGIISDSNDLTDDRWSELKKIKMN